MPFLKTAYQKYKEFFPDLPLQIKKDEAGKNQDTNESKVSVATSPFPELVSSWGSSKSYNFANVNQIELIDNFNRFVDDIAARSNNCLWGDKKNPNHNILVGDSYAPDLECLSYGDAFVPYYRESTIIRRLYTRSTGSTAGFARFQTYDSPNDSFLKEHAQETWSVIGKMLNNGNLIINALSLLNSSDAASEHEISAEMRVSLNELIKEFLTDYQQLQLPEAVSVQGESEFFYPISDDELDLLTGEQLLTIALQEKSSVEPGQLLARILVSDEAWEKMNAAFVKHDEEIGKRADNPKGKVAELREWRKQFASVTDSTAFSSLPAFLKACVNNLESCFNEQLKCFLKDENQEQLDLLIKIFLKLPAFKQRDCQQDYIDAGNKLIQSFIEAVNSATTLSEKSTCLVALSKIKSQYPQFVSPACNYSVLSDRVLSFALFKTNEPYSKEVMDDLLKLKEFCDQKLALNKDNQYGDAYIRSLESFYINAVRIRLSGDSLQDQAKNIMKSAQEEFKPRHSTRRLIADVLMMVGSLFTGLGLVVSNTRQVSGKSFFFSQAPTSREEDLFNNWLVEKKELKSTDGSLFKTTAPAA